MINPDAIYGGKTPCDDTIGVTIADARRRFQTLRLAAESIPPEQLDMRRLFGDCGCIYKHAPKQARLVTQLLNQTEYEWLFEDPEDRLGYTYDVWEGQSAKDEFLRRLAALEAKYCGGVA